ncbi:hypothetical protein C8R42DRAFT_650691 [Lentinula raphanica]|nr:hypothetical protein C8R42DRAFT_650691 [Lentinula raphanica]
MPAFGENQAFDVDVQDALPYVRANRRRNRSVLETTMVFRTAGESGTRVRAENASRLRIKVTGPKPDEEYSGFEATAFGRSSYNTQTSVTITHHDVNLALDARRPRPLVRFVSVGPISEEDILLEVGKTPPPYDPPETPKPETVKTRPVSAPVLSAEEVKRILDTPPARRAPAPLWSRNSNPPGCRYDDDSDDSADSPLNSPAAELSYRPFQFSGGRSVEPRRMVLNEPLPSLCPRSPSESSFTENVETEEEEENGDEIDQETSSDLQDTYSSSESLQNDDSVTTEVEPPVTQEQGTESNESLAQASSVEHTVEGVVSLTDSAHSLNSDRSQHPRRVISLTKAVKLKLYGSRSPNSSSTLPSSRSSMSPPSAFRRFERALGAATDSTTSLSSRVSLKNVNEGKSSPGGKAMKALFGKAMGIGKGMKRSREEDENVDPGDGKEESDRPIAGRRTKRKL